MKAIEALFLGLCHIQFEEQYRKIRINMLSSSKESYERSYRSMRESLAIESLEKIVFLITDKKWDSIGDNFEVLNEAIEKIRAEKER
jgi:hypothetical protein